MKVAMMQPSFLPWQGFFELVYKSDVFIFLDDFQFSVQSYHQRNRLFVNKGQVDWYTVPVQKSISFKSPLCLTKINETIPWRIKMWKRVQQNYSKAPCFADIAPHVEKWLLSPAESLAEQNIRFINLVCKLLNYERKFLFSSHYKFTSQRSRRVIELLHGCGASRYFCAKGSFAYMLEDGVFPIKEIEVLFQDFRPKPYKQIGATDDFVPNLSVLDALMNVGSEVTAELIKNGTSKWLTWQEMASSRSTLDVNKEASGEDYQ